MEGIFGSDGVIGRGAVLRARLKAAEEALSSGHLEDFQVAMAPEEARMSLIPVKMCGKLTS